MKLHEDEERKIVVKRLLQMLPSSHTVLLSAVLRLLRAITNSAHTKMNARSLAVCIAPSLLDCPSKFFLLPRIIFKINHLTSVFLFDISKFDSANAKEKLARFLRFLCKNLFI